MIKTLTAALLALACTAALAGEDKYSLKQAPGLDKVKANCSICHSNDYIQLNSTFLDRKGWDAEVTKMIKAFGAPVKAEDVKDIVDYLVKNYGKE
jgi:sulfite dehydrogenase (cytochrome) subunit B